jgi:hypothetical protein
MNTSEPKHEWDLLSDYCIHCGLSRVHELDAPVKCHRELNIIAVSHIMYKRVTGIIHGIRTSLTNSNRNS